VLGSELRDARSNKRTERQESKTGHDDPLAYERAVVAVYLRWVAVHFE
jgi:hypothetical protein